jgi:hypothetical protein
MSRGAAAAITPAQLTKPARNVLAFPDALGAQRGGGALAAEALARAKTPGTYMYL